jgi:BirA family transcriptional regulator, biotin operon repressor / biotin---[acetyl-CoA-carboxylase] ligase
MKSPPPPSPHPDKPPAPAAILGATLLRFDELASTNDRARELALQGMAEGVAVIARKQTAGRGRQGRNWSSPADAGLYLSLILRPRATPAQASLITLAAAVAVCETLGLDFAVTADIKWPNDILLNQRKLCGILVESAIENSQLQYAILGIGVNLSQSQFPEELQQTATSLLLETGRRITPDEFLQALLLRLDSWYRLCLAQPQLVIARWQQLSSFARDCAVRITSGDTVIEGITRGLTAAGGLLVELDDGQLREIVSGEVSLRKAEV